MDDKIVRIGGAAGFWGDTHTSATQLVNSGNVDYLIFDYLAEITMSILSRVMARNPEAGFVPDFVDPVMSGIIAGVAERGIRIVSNAGGINPQGCRDALEKLAEAQGIPLKIATVTGDNLAERADEFRGQGVTEIDTGEPLPTKLMSMNAYLGAIPIAQAFAQGAQVVITGRCADSALALGALMHEFGWAEDAYDLLAQGSLCGHLLECNAQATGGGYTDWEDVEGTEDMGSPIAECRADGSFVITKPEGSGGLVVPSSVAEQMLYEIGDPRAYLLPDVTLDLTQVRMEQVGPHRVAVSGARGRPPTDTYKVSATFQDGWRATTGFMQGGGKAADKGRVAAETILTRTRRMFRERGWEDYRETSIEVVGAEDTYGQDYRNDFLPREVWVKIAVKHAQREAVELFAREIAPVALMLAPGLTGFYAGRPSAVPVVRLYSCLVPKEALPVAVEMDGASAPVKIPVAGGFDPDQLTPVSGTGGEIPEGARVEVPLVALAYGRSGDKGDHANIGIIARRPEYVPYLREVLSEARVAAFFAHYLKGEVHRYELPGIHAFNFLLTHVLGGGGMASLRLDPQGKAYAQMLLDMHVEVPEVWAREQGLTPQAESA